jgi:hypothetical protein
VLDLLVLGLLIVGFAAAFGYVRVCAKVTEPTRDAARHLTTDARQ